MTFVGESPGITRVRRAAERLAPTPLPVLIRGETGTGKEVLARWIHARSDRVGPFVAVDCAGLAPSLIESELFGHRRGAFTGATQSRDGLVAAAEGGTFFLDEIGELPLDVQTRLLRLLDNGTYRPVGADRERHAGIRVIAATWRDLHDHVKVGRFRRDLYHRLVVADLVLPPLRDRGADLDRLLDHLLNAESAAAGRPTPTLSAPLRSHLRRWPWPGNIRELRNVARYLATLTSGPQATLKDLPRRLHAPVPAAPLAGAVPVRADLPYLDARRAWLDAFQFRYVSEVLARHSGNVSAAARASGMDRRSIQRILRRAAEAN